MLFNDTSAHIKDRYVNAEILNITELTDGMKVGFLVYLTAEYFNIINETELKDEMIASLIR